MKKAVRSLLTVLIVTFTSSSSSQTYGSWTVGTGSDGMPFVVTTNDSGAMLGKWCTATSATCFWMLVTTQPKCQEGAMPPMLVNAAGLGAKAINSTCVQPITISGQINYRLLLAPHDDVENIVSGATKIGFAMALEEDGFRVIRFSLNGSSLALTRWSVLAEKAVKVINQGTRDQSL